LILTTRMLLMTRELTLDETQTFLLVMQKIIFNNLNADECDDIVGKLQLELFNPGSLLRK